MRTLSLVNLLGLLLVPTLVACSSPTGENPSSQSSAVQGGDTDSDLTHGFAVGIYSRKYGALCSGTLIAPNLVLTARHCVVPPGADEAVTCSDKFAANVAPSALQVTTAPSFHSAQTLYTAQEIITPDDTSFCGNDIALLILDDNIPASEAKPATPVVQFSMSDHSKIGKQITAVGYGITSPSSQDAGMRRIRTDIPIKCVPGDSAFSCSGSYKSMVDSSAEFVTEGYVCSGDSGSGAFDQDSFEKGTPYVLGALSRGPQTDTDCLAAIYSRTDAHKDMIIAAGAKAAQAGGYEAADWVTPKSTTGDTAGGTDSPACSGDTCSSTSPTDPAPATATGGGNGTVTTKTTTTTCSAAPVSRTAGTPSALALLAGALVFARRRRR